MIVIHLPMPSCEELSEAIACKPNRILLDNMDIDTLIKAVKLTNGLIPLEASGNISLDTVRYIALTGVDYISVGAPTHSVRVLDISLLLNIKTKKE
jgi:nicotinate-nucleotide pyrophosphorylase (carboxylating)